MGAWLLLPRSEGALASFLCSYTVRAWAAGCLIWLLVWAVRPLRATHRHFIRTTTLFGLLVLPALVYALPPFQIVPLAFWHLPSWINSLQQAVNGFLGFSWARLVTAVWGLGFCILAWRFLFRAMGLKRLTSRARRVTKGPLFDQLQLLVAWHGMPRPVKLYLGKSGTMPMTWGLLRPAILLPDETFGWTSEQRTSVLQHELAHIRRHDFALQLLEELACLLNWLNPFAWLMAAANLRDREYACDDEVIRSGIRPSDYAAYLLAIASLPNESRPLFPMAAHAADVRCRIFRILNRQILPKTLRPAGAATLATAVAALLWLSACLGPTSGSHLTSSEDSAPSQEAHAP